MPPDHWAAPSACEGWRVVDVLGHLAASDVAVAALLAEEEATELEEYRKSLDGDDVTPDGWNGWTVERRRDESPVSLGLEWGRAADRTLTLAARASDEDWNDRQIAWVAGDLRLKYLIQARIAEWWQHGEDMREGGRLPPRREHWPVHVTCDLAIRLVPYWLARSGRTVADRTVRFDLDGVGGGTWLQSTSAGRDVPDGATPDAYIEGTGYALASVASGRADADFTLYEGLLNLGGATDVADAVIHTMRSYP
jgi:uncharacterized protein (TIGR03083 family)